MYTGNNVGFAELIWEDFKNQIESKKTSKQKKELLPFSRFTKLIIKYILSNNDHISKRLQSYQHVIKVDATLGNLNFAKKGTTYPVFGKPIPVVMLSDEIMASADYSEYLAKSKGSKPVKASGRGKGLLSKEGVEIVVERVSIPKRRRSKTVVEEVAQPEEVADEVDSEETDDDEPVVRRRPTGVVTRSGVQPESEEENVDHSKKLKGEGSGVTIEVLDELTLKSSNEGAGVTPEVLDEPSDNSSSSSFESENAVEDISSDEADVTEKC
ncbi:hypothetical protein Tco_0867352 [Tanacetum coccineum]